MQLTGTLGPTIGLVRTERQVDDLPYFRPLAIDISHWPLTTNHCPLTAARHCPNATGGYGRGTFLLTPDTCLFLCDGHLARTVPASLRARHRFWHGGRFVGAGGG